MAVASDNLSITFLLLFIYPLIFSCSEKSSNILHIHFICAIIFTPFRHLFNFIFKNKVEILGVA